MPGPTVLYIAGDVHLGAAHGGGDAFTGWLDRLAGRPPQRLVILGDLFEYWLECPAAVRRYADVLGRFRRLRSLGWRIDLVKGNRELVAERVLPAAMGAAMHWPRLDIRLGNTLIRIVHGDRLVVDPLYAFFAAWWRSFIIRVVGQVLPQAGQDGIARMLRANSRSRQRSAYRQGRRVFIDPRRVRAAARGADVLVAGHVHESWRRRFGGVDFSLVGDWPPGGGHWIEADAAGRLTACSLP